MKNKLKKEQIENISRDFFEEYEGEKASKKVMMYFKYILSKMVIERKLRISENYYTTNPNISDESYFAAAFYEKMLETVPGKIKKNDYINSYSDSLNELEYKTLEKAYIELLDIFTYNQESFKELKRAYRRQRLLAA